MQETPKEMKMFSMFTGIGGFDLACRNLKINITGACEIDNVPRSIYSKQFPGVTIHRDATKLDPKELEDFDLLCAGFPCQAFSMAGKRRGFDDTRGSLIFDVLRVAKEKKPSYLLLENVKGLLSHDQGRTFRTIIAALDEVGYDVEWQVINGKYWVPQGRERIFIIGHLRGKSKPKVFCKYDTIENKNDRRGTQKSQNISATLSTKQDRWPNAGIVRVILALNREKERKNGRRIKDHNEPSFTLTCMDKHGVQVDDKYRFFTPTEQERLMGFPDDWTKYNDEGKEMSISQRGHVCGNAVIVPQVQWIIEQILK